MGVSFLIENNPTNFEINDYDHDLWLFFLNLLPHRIENLCWTLNFYLGNTELKNKLTKLIRRYKAYEWMVYNLIKCISNIHTIQKSELSFYLSMIDNNSPWIVKKSIYEYLFRDADESYDKRSLLNKLKNEKLFLRKIIIDFILKNTIEINREEIWRVLK